MLYTPALNTVFLEKTDRGVKTRIPLSLHFPTYDTISPVQLSTLKSLPSAAPETKELQSLDAKWVFLLENSDLVSLMRLRGERPDVVDYYDAWQTFGTLRLPSSVERVTFDLGSTSDEPSEATRETSTLLSLDTEGVSPYADASAVVIPKGTMVSHMIKWGHLKLQKDTTLAELSEDDLDVRELFGLEVKE